MKIGVIFIHLTENRDLSVTKGFIGDVDSNIQRCYYAVECGLLSQVYILLNPAILFCLSSVAAGSSPEEPVEEPPEGLQPDGAAGGQRLPPSHCCLHPQFDTDHGRGGCLQSFSV